MRKINSLFHHLEPTLQELEETYRLHYLQGDIAQTILILLLIIAGNMVFLPSDYFLFKQSRMLHLVLAIRCVFILGSFAFVLLIRRITQPKVYDRSVFFCLILVAAFQAM